MEKKELLLVNLIDEFFTFCPDKAQGCVIDGDSELLGKRIVCSRYVGIMNRLVTCEPD